MHFGCGIDEALLSSEHHTFSAEIYTVLLGLCVCVCVCVCVWVCARFKERASVGVCVCLNLSGRFACSVDYMSVHTSSTPKCMTCFHPSVRLFPLLSAMYVIFALNVSSLWYLFVHMPTNAYPVKSRFISTHSQLIVKLLYTVLNTSIQCRINCVNRIGLFHVTDLSVFLICLTSQSGLPKLNVK